MTSSVYLLFLLFGLEVLKFVYKSHKLLIYWQISLNML